jgi:site-specific recombinase XerD
MTDATTALVVVEDAAFGAPVDLERLDAEANEFAKSARSDSTRKAYRLDLKAFLLWCRSAGLRPLPAEPSTVRCYVTHLANERNKVATIERKVAAISKAHRAQGLESPTRSGLVGDVLAGIRKRLGEPQKQAKPLEPKDVLHIASTFPDTLRGRRDRLILTLGFVIGARCDDLSRILVEHIQDTVEGLLITLPRSKTDQDGHGRLIGVPYQSDPLGCPVRALRAWQQASGIVVGPLIRSVDRHSRVGTGAMSAESIGDTITRMASTAGLLGRYSGHSLRAGFCTTAARLGRSEHAIMAVTGHRSADTLRRYIRRGTVWQDNASAGLL